jgi:hypothetical protein
MSKVSKDSITIQKKKQKIPKIKNSHWKWIAEIMKTFWKRKQKKIMIKK